MNHIDFFEEYSKRKQTLDKLFNLIESKIIPLNENLMDEAFLGIIPDAKDREEEIKKFFKAVTTNNKRWAPYNIFLGDNNDPKFVQIGKATPEQKELAWKVISDLGNKDSFKGKLGPHPENKNVLAYIPSKKIKADSENESNQNSKTGDTQDNQAVKPDYKVYKTKQGYFFGKDGNRFVKQMIEPGDASLMNYDWEGSDLKYLFDPSLKFAGNQMGIDLKKEIITNFVGIWENGPFNGNTFVGTYIGDSFKGNFKGNNTDFNPNKESVREKAISFIDGTFSDRLRSGVLGAPNVIEYSGSFHLIQIPVGYSIEILTNNQLRHTITVTKRIDGGNSNFTFYVYLGYEVGQSEPKAITLSWPQIRANFDAYQISESTNNLPGLLKLQSGESILEIKIVKAGTPPNFERKEKFDDKKDYSVDLGKIATLKSIAPSLPDYYPISLDIEDDASYENFLKTKNYLSSNQFLRDIDTIGKAISYNKIGNVSRTHPDLIKLITSDLLSEGVFDVNIGEPNYGYEGDSDIYFSERNKTDFENHKAYLEKKYENYFQKYGQYPQEYFDQINKIKKLYFPKSKTKVQPSPSSSISMGAPLEKKSPEYAALDRLQSLVRFFIEKIKSDDPSKAQEIKQFLFDLIKGRLMQYKQIKPQPQQPQSQTQQVQTQSQSQQKPSKKKPLFTSTKKGKKRLKESELRLEIRKILSDIL